MLEAVSKLYFGNIQSYSHQMSEEKSKVSKIDFVIL
ncbi:hypothetical protein BBOR36S_04913 [Brevibacillus borstelensis]